MWTFNIDIVGGCNLSCPSCPVGNSDYAAVPKGYMKPELLDRIVRKAIAECGDLKVSLYNWTEPFLHPKLATMIRTVTSLGVECDISSNLNILKNEDEVLAANPGFIRVSLSGFSQQRYSQTHRDGDVEVVKANMARLAAAKKRTGSKTRLQVIFHRYIDNGADEMAMRDYAASLGYVFKVVWAYLMPVEKVIEYAKPGSGYATVTSEDRVLIDRFALRLDKALAVSREVSTPECRLQDHEFAITVRGEAMLCCGTYEPKYSVGSFVDQPLADIQRKRHSFEICDDCTGCGVKALGLYEAGSRLDEIAMDSIRARYPSAIALAPMFRQRKKRVTDPIRSIVHAARDRLRVVRRHLARRAALK